MKIITTGNVDTTNYPLGIDLNIDLVTIILPLIELFKKQSEYHNKNINLYCSGSSGAIMATIFSMHVNQCRILHVKKDGERAHNSNYSLSPITHNSINVIIDDFICTGDTLNRIYPHVRDGKVDCLVVSGKSFHNVLKFECDTIICGIEAERP
jgi:hypothetical protein